jgi:hypothetical protein
VIAPQLSMLMPHSVNKAFQHLHIECLINSDPLRYKFKVNDTRNVEKVDQQCLDLGLLTCMAALACGNSSISTPWTRVWLWDHTGITMFHRQRSHD